jgi:hypothetical protein
MSFFLRSLLALLPLPSKKKPPLLPKEVLSTNFPDHSPDHLRSCLIGFQIGFIHNTSIGFIQGLFAPPACPNRQPNLASTDFHIIFAQ